MMETSEPANGLGSPAKTRGGRQVWMGHLEGLLGGRGYGPLWHLLRINNNVPMDSRGLCAFGRGEGVLEWKPPAACNW